MEHFKVKVCDKSIKVGGKQYIQTLEGCTFPLPIKNGLAYLKCLGAPTDSDLQQYPHVMFTSPHEWDPSIQNYEFTEDEVTPMSVGESFEPPEALIHNLFDEYVEFNKRVIHHLNTLLDVPVPSDSGEYHSSTSVHLHASDQYHTDFEAMCPFFGWISATSI